MRSPSGRLLFVILFLQTCIRTSVSLKCHLYHRIWEDSRLLQINPDICHTSSEYCVRATYSDPDSSKKNGFSMGCDKVDCKWIGNVMYTGWYNQTGGMTCRKSKDYGKKVGLEGFAANPLTLIIIPSEQQKSRKHFLALLAETRRQGKLNLLKASVTTVKDSLTGYGSTWTTSLQKAAGSLRNMEQHLITENEGDELSVTAQMMLEQSIYRAMNLTEECMRQHKDIHNIVSKIGKTVDRQFAKDIGSFFAREKNLEDDEVNHEVACSLIFDFLMSEGMIEAANSLRKEANLKEKESIESGEMVKSILDDLQNHSVDSAISYLTEMAPHETKLRYDLQKQKTLQLVVDGYEKEAMISLKKLRFLGNEIETPRIMGAVLRGTSSIEDSRYKDFYDEAIWDELAHRMADIMSPVKSDISEVIDTGRETISVLHGLKRTFSKGHLAIEEELPVEIKVKRHIHSTFTCPILKEQSSERNPPMKLLCGHVISRDAMQRLSATRLINPRAQMPRPTRLKCPYCPREQSFDSAKQVLFSHVQL